MTPKEISALQEWYCEATEQDIAELPSSNGVECGCCGATQDVVYIELYRYSFWLCPDCLTKVPDLPMYDTQPRGALKLRFQVFDRDDYRCVYCGRSPKENGALLEVDHVFPRSKGGTDIMENLVTACHECNAGKGDMLLKIHERNNWG